MAQEPLSAIEVYAILNGKVKQLQQYAVSGLNYKGAITSLNQVPTTPTKGDLYISNTEGILTGFNNINVFEGDGLIWNGSNWDKITYSSLVELKSDYIIVDKYSNLTPQTKSKIAYVLNDEKINGNDFLKGFYVYDITQTTPVWSFIKMGGGDFSLSKWTPNTEYKKDDYAVYNYKIYKCLIDNTSTINFEVDLRNNKWELFVGYELDFKFWESNKVYKINEYVIHDYKLYKSLTEHTSTTDFDLDLVGNNWQLILGGSNFKLNKWEQNKQYEIEDVVYTNYKLYKCVTQHISTTDIETDIVNWEHIVGFDEFTLNEWQPTIDYKVGQVVYKDLKLYKALLNHTSSLIFEDDLTLGNWELIVGGSDFKLNKWEQITEYNEDDYVVYDYKIYKCITAHTSTTNFENDIANWELFVGNDGLEFKIWATGEDYKEKEYVVYENSLYQAKEEIVGDIEFDIDKYDLIVGCKCEKIEEWKPNVEYLTNDLVTHDGNTLKCIIDHTSEGTFTENEEGNWIYHMEVYYSVKQSQYNLMVNNGLIDTTNKHLFIVEDSIEEAFEFEMEFVDQTIVTVQHNLKELHPTKVIVFDDEGDEILFPEIDYKTENLLTITFDIPVSGKVIVRK